MADTIPQTVFTRELLTVLSEACESVQGIFLDPKTSLFETLAGISASEASIPVGGKCATIAAQVAHVNFYMEAIERFLVTRQNEKLDWGEIWRTVSGVTPDEWLALQARLKQTYLRLRQLIESSDGWEKQYEIAGAIGLVAHTAYHLGEIRQATCTVR